MRLAGAVAKCRQHHRLWWQASREDLTVYPNRLNILSSSLVDYVVPGRLLYVIPGRIRINQL